MDLFIKPMLKSPRFQLTAILIVSSLISACGNQPNLQYLQPRPFPKIVDLGLKPLAVEQPCYPAKAARDGTEGWVQVEFSLNNQGQVDNVVSLDNSPAGIFEACAMRSFQKWVFELPETYAPEKRYRYVFQFKLG